MRGPSRRAAFRSVVVVVGLGLGLGCGRNPLTLTIGDVDASAGAVGAASGSGPVDSGGAAGAMGDAGFCSSPAACNDDPLISSLEGTCHVFDGSPPAWFCDCRDGFSANPRTGLCRTGSACVASANDAWAFRSQIDATDCARRPTLDCPQSSSTADVSIMSALWTIAEGPCRYPEALQLRLELVDGCPTLLQASRRGGSLGDQDTTFLACFLSRLRPVRLGCAAATSCELLENDLLP